MSPDCRHLLGNGQPCRCPALSGDVFCRHHTPEALARRRAPAGGPDGNDGSPLDPDTGLDPAHLHAYWRSFHRLIPTGDADFCSGLLEMVMDALASRDISHRSAGRLIAAVLDRRRVLAAQALEARCLAIAQSIGERCGAAPPATIAAGRRI